jgi:ubiquinone/menaquinone biosynthesis C-methylase UbiE
MSLCESKSQNLKSKIEMGFYSKYIFPHLLEWALGNPELGKYRRRALQEARGNVLEVGFGTGLNLPYYPQAVDQITALDPESMLADRVAERIKKSNVPVNLVQLDASGKLPFADATFDSVVTTWTLCSIAQVEPALAEMRRLLKPDGRYLFFEHGRSDQIKTAKWQDRFNPIERVIGEGCNINRPIDRLIKAAGFEIETLERFLMPKTPRILGEMYSGTARRI